MHTEGLSQEDKDYVIDQIEKMMGSRPHFYLKFCSEEKFAQDVCDGNLYCNTAKYFREKEIESGERGQGDQYELFLLADLCSVEVYDPKTQKLIFFSDNLKAQIQYKNDDLRPIVCFMGIPWRDLVLVEADETHATFQLPFSGVIYENMIERFGKYCVIVGAAELEEKIASVCAMHGCEYVFDAVNYCISNSLERVKIFLNGEKERFLYKNEDLSYQHEYRLVLGAEIPKDHFFRIGKLETASIVRSDTLQNLEFTIQYTSHPREV